MAGTIAADLMFKRTPARMVKKRLRRFSQPLLNRDD